MTKFEFDIEPVEQTRPRAKIVKAFDRKTRIFKNSVSFYDVKKVNEYKVLLGMLARQQVKMKQYKKPKGALNVSFTFVRPIPKRFTKKQREMALNLELLPITKPDLSNYIKSTEDALNKILWEDDNEIVQEMAMKIFGIKPKVIVEVRVINENTY